MSSGPARRRADAARLPLVERLVPTAGWLRGYRRSWLRNDLIGRQLARQGVDLWVAALPTRALAKARHTAAWSEWAAAGRLHPTVAAAVSAHESEERHDPG